MILKDKENTSSRDSRLDAGIKQELDVAFYLRRAFKNHPKVFVFNDLTISFDNETAQIDHLIVYQYGFLIIESKSIKGHVLVNQQAEWTRSVGNSWVGMPSPIRQAELQLELLRKYICAHTEQLVGKILGIQTGLSMRCYDAICAISSDAIIDRTEAPTNVTKRLAKSEFIVDAIKQVMDEIPVWNIVKWVLNTRPSFTQKELHQLCDFMLMSQNQQPIYKAQEVRVPELHVWAPPSNLVKEQPQPHLGHSSLQPAEAERPIPANTATPANFQAATFSMPRHMIDLHAQCKYCGAMRGLTPASGRYGYYVQCGHCGKNTPLKRPCLSCKSHNTKVSKRDLMYRLQCADCKQSALYDNLS